MRATLLVLLLLGACSRFQDNPADDAKMAAAKTKCRSEAIEVTANTIVFAAERGLAAFDNCLRREGYP